MKKTIQFLTALALMMLATVSMYAQPGGGRGGRMNPEQMAERQATMMQDSLLLSDDLTAEVENVLMVYAKKMQEARSNAQGDRESMRETMQTLRSEQNEELQAMLGDEKWAKWETIQAEMMKNRGQRGQRGERGSGRSKKS